MGPDPAITAVVLSGAGERGLCAGGDLVPLYDSARAGGADARKFWFDEYRLDAKVGSFPKPYVSLMDGIVMGGGVGVSAHGSIRVVTETSKIAMPEVSIGFVPDVGGTYLLSRAPGLLGLHTALTGAPFSGADAIALGFADHYVPHTALGRSPPPSSVKVWKPPSAPTRRSHRRVSFWPSGTGSTSATRVRPRSRSWRHCGATTQVRPTTRPT